MSLLTLSGVTKRHASGRREQVALRSVSLEVDSGELVVVWGLRRSGRTTLLRVAAGMEPPDEGTVRFDGRDLADSRGTLLGTDIGYYNVNFVAAQGGAVVDHVAVGLLARGVPRDRARAQADAVLERVGARPCADLDPRSLDPNEQALVGIARALVAGPRLLLLDDPANGVDPLYREPLVALVRSVADDGVAVLMAVSDAITGADRVLTIDRGELRGALGAQEATVVQLHRARAERFG